MPDARPLDLHKALADDTRYRLYRYIGLAARPVSVREMSRRLQLHPNTLRPHLRRLEEAGLVASETSRAAAVGRPQTLYSIRETRDAQPAGDYRLLAEMLCGLVRSRRQLDQARELARQWGAWMVVQDSPKPGSRPATRRNLAVLQEAMARAGFDPRFRRDAEGGVEVTMRDCPFRDLADEYRELVCTMHLGLVEGMTEGLKPSLEVREFHPFAERGLCRARIG
jgi:predicted ArsR family transcriptional regulator